MFVLFGFELPQGYAPVLAQNKMKLCAILDIWRKGLCLFSQYVNATEMPIGDWAIQTHTSGIDLCIFDIISFSFIFVWFSRIGDRRRAEKANYSFRGIWAIKWDLILGLVKSTGLHVFASMLDQAQPHMRGKKPKYKHIF
ncbi:hypothetical protein ACJX0J_031947 [Zea mays]